MKQRIRATHLFDCADVGKTIVEEGKRAGLPWKQIQGPWTRGSSTAAYYRFRAEQALAYPRTQLWHVHMGGRARWARGSFNRPYALTLHGTDIRESYWSEASHATIKADVDLARQVWYTTPDLREKAEAARSDVQYMALPINIAELPAWEPAARPTVFFASRWDNSKGGDEWIQTAVDVVKALKGQDVDIVGLNWGERVAEVAGLGIRLEPHMAKPDYLAKLAQSHVVVGQVAGILAASELQAIGMGIPTIFADQVGGYPKDVATVNVTRADIGEAVRAALQDPVTLSKKLAGPAYIQRTHAPSVFIPQLVAGYEKVLGAFS